MTSTMSNTTLQHNKWWEEKFTGNYLIYAQISVLLDQLNANFLKDIIRDSHNVWPDKIVLHEAIIALFYIRFFNSGHIFFYWIKTQYFLPDQSICLV